MDIKELKIGEKIKFLRQANDLTQEELAERANLTKGFISQVERDITSLSVESLAQILDALDGNLSDFFKKSAEEKIVFSKKDKIIVERENITKYEVLIPGATNWEMDPVLVTLSPNEKSEEDEPHIGDEFGYVLKGKIILTYGKRTFKLKTGDCFYFTANKQHFIENKSNKQAVLLWVSSPPSF